MKMLLKEENDTLKICFHPEFDPRPLVPKSNTFTTRPRSARLTKTMYIEGVFFPVFRRRNDVHWNEPHMALS